MDNQPIAFFWCAGNELLEAQRLTCLFSASFTTQPKNLYFTNGVFIHKTPKDNIRRSLALFCVRSLTNHTWRNSNVFIGKSEDD